MSKEPSSEKILHTRARKEWWRRFLKTAVPAFVIGSIILVIFFDWLALWVVLFGIVGGMLIILFFSGDDEQQHRTKRHFDSSNRHPGGFSRPPAPPSNLGKPKESSSTSNRPSPYTTTEGYENLVRAYHQPRGPIKSSNDSKKGKQSQLGAKTSNVALIVTLLVVAILIWLFG